MYCSYYYMLIFHVGEIKETWCFKSCPLSPNNYLDMPGLAVDEIYCLGKADCLQNCGEKLMSGCSYIIFGYFFQDSFLGLWVFHSYPMLARSPYHGPLKTCLSCVPLLQSPLGNCLNCWVMGILNLCSWEAPGLLPPQFLLLRCPKSIRLLLPWALRPQL